MPDQQRETYEDINKKRQERVDAHNKLFEEGKATNRLVLKPTGVVAMDQTQLMEAAPEFETVSGGRFLRPIPTGKRGMPPKHVTVNGNGEIIEGAIPTGTRLRDSVPAEREALAEDLEPNVMVVDEPIANIHNIEIPPAQHFEPREEEDDPPPKVTKVRR